MKHKRPPLFMWGSFTASSGQDLDWKIECDHLTKSDIDCIARVAAQSLPPFGRVVHIPTGGARIGAALAVHKKPGCNTTLIVDDVWTTGRSVLDAAREFDDRGDLWFGFVIFARGDLHHPDVFAFAQTM